MKRVSLCPLAFTEAVAALVKVKPAVDDEEDEEVDEKKKRRPKPPKGEDEG